MSRAPVASWNMSNQNAVLFLHLSCFPDVMRGKTAFWKR